MLSRLRVNRKTLVLSLALISVCGVGLGIREALSADADLQQYNGTPMWSENLTTASTLLPRDGKRITADNNAVGSAPVNRSLRQIKDMLIGVHDAVIGSRAGAAQKTLKSIHVDYANPGLDSGPGLFGIYVGTSGGHGGVRADSESWFGKISIGQFPSLRATLDEGLLKFTGTNASNSNPSVYAPNPNTLDALTIPKAWVTFETDGSGSVNIRDGARVFSMTVESGKIKVSFASAFDNVYYLVAGSNCFVSGAPASLGVNPTDKATNYCKISCGGFDPATTVITGNLLFFGRQTT